MSYMRFLLLLRCFLVVSNFEPVLGLLPQASSSASTSSSPHETSTIHRQTYAKYWEDILVAEFQHTSRQLQEQRSTWSRRRLEKHGISVFGAVAEPDTELFGEKVVRIVKPYALVSFHERFSRGDVLLVTPNVPNVDPLTRECLVMDVGKDWMSVGIGHTWLPGLWESRKVVGLYQVRLDRGAPQAPLKAQKRALRRLERGVAGPISDLLARFFQYNSTDTDDCASKMPAYLRAECGDEHLENLIRSSLEQTKEEAPFPPNKSQQEAIVWALKRSISLIRGPAGTGKTRVAAMLIATALKIFSHQKSENSKPPQRVLAVAHSNGAADVLLEALLQLGVPAVRLGRPATVSPQVQHRTVVAMAEKLPRMAQLRRIIGDLSMDSRSRSSAVFELRQSMLDMQHMILHTAPVVVTSCIGAHQLFDLSADPTGGCHFPLVVLDEAAQTTEPALICALAAAQAEQVIMVGDTRQLPPTITFMELRDTLGVSPMARLEHAGVGIFTLRTQYRMHPCLLEHPSRYFYNGLVGCADSVMERAKYEKTPNGFPWPSPSQPLAFVDIGSGCSEVAHGSGGRSNPTEAKVVADIVANLLTCDDLEASHISVISPYAKQVQCIRNELASQGLVPDMESVKVGTVDSFQGQETDVVLISAVRSNPMQELGFLRDPRRLCVAITRARRGLIIIGDRSVLDSCRHWAALLSSCDNRGCSMEAKDVPRRDNILMRRERLEKSKFEALELFDDSDEFYGLFSK